MIMKYQFDYRKIIVEGKKMIYKRIKLLREAAGMTQTELAKKLGITRSSINAWEMGISVPSTQYIVELSRLFKVSSDYILGIDNTVSIDASGLSDEAVSTINSLVNILRDNSK